MNIKVYKSHLEKMIAQRNGYLVLASGALLLCLMQSLIILFMYGKERIVVVPPSIEKRFWVSANDVSPEYLSEMSLFFSNLRLNATPESAKHQHETLLQYTDPSFYNLLKDNLVKEEDKLNEQHISMYFIPTTDVRVNTNKLQAIVEGDLKSFVGDAVLPSKHAKYLVSYGYRSGRLFVKSFEEVKDA